MIKNTDLNIGPISTDNIDLPITEWTKPMICIIFHHGSDSDPAYSMSHRILGPFLQYFY